MTTLLKFLSKLPPGSSPATVTTPTGRGVIAKYGIYPLGTEDLIVSLPVFEVILHTLRTGGDDQRELAALLQRMYRASIGGTP